MTATPNMVYRTVRLPLSVSTNAALMGQFLGQITPLVFSDATGTYYWFVNQYDPATSNEFTLFTWVMSSANDTNFMTTILPGMLTQAGMSGVTTFSSTVTVGY